MSLAARAATCCGLVCSSATMYWIGRPLMPPLSLTQVKNACAMVVIPEKSVPGCLVTIAPSLSGSPVAFWPLPRPHLPPVVVAEAPAATGDAAGLAAATGEAAAAGLGDGAADGDTLGAATAGDAAG